MIFLRDISIKISHICCWDDGEDDKYLCYMCKVFHFQEFHGQTGLKIFSRLPTAYHLGMKKYFPTPLQNA